MRAISLVEAGQSVAKTTVGIDITGSGLYHWIKQDKIVGVELSYG